MSVAASLNILLSASTGNLKAVFGSAQKTVAGFGSSVNNVRKGLLTFQNVATAYGAGKIAHFVAAQMQAVDDADDLAHRLGLTTSKLMQLRHAAVLNGSSGEEMDAAFQKMNIVLGEAATGSEGAEKALSKVGLTIEALEGMTPEQAFYRIADGIKGISDPTRRAAAMQELFGRSSARTTTFLMKGSAAIKQATADAREYAGALSDIQIQGIKAANDALDNTKTIGSRLTQQFASGLAPAIQYVADLLSSGARIGVAGFSAMEMAGKAVGAVVIVLGKGIDFVFTSIKTLSIGLQKTLVVSLQAAQAVLEAMGKTIDSSFTEDARKLGTAIDTFQRGIDQQWAENKKDWASIFTWPADAVAAVDQSAAAAIQIEKSAEKTKQHMRDWKGNELILAGTNADAAASARRATIEAPVIRASERGQREAKQQAIDERQANLLQRIQADIATLVRNSKPQVEFVA